jgi:hypothetical protein
MLRPDGKFEIVARSGAIMVSSDSILGPYKLQGPSIYAGMLGLPLHNLEDPVIWYSGGMYHIVVNCWSERKVFHLTSPDGIGDWKRSGSCLRSDYRLRSLQGWNPKSLGQDGAAVRADRKRPCRLLHLRRARRVLGNPVKWRPWVFSDR